jgi:hypothetical protein
MTIVKVANTKRKRGNSLRVVEVKHVQVPDAEERLARVFRILTSRFVNTPQAALISSQTHDRLPDHGEEES